MGGTLTVSYRVNVMLGARTGANLNSVADQAIAMCSPLYIVRRIVVQNASISLTTAAGGIYTGAGKTGITLVAAAQVYASLTAAAKYLDLTLEAIAGTDAMTAAALLLSLTTAQGAAATADIYVLGDMLK